MNGGNEDDRRLLKAGMLPKHSRQLESVELRHAHVDEDHRHVGLEKILQRLSCRVRLDQHLTQLLKDHLIAEELRGLVVNEENIDGIMCGHLRKPRANGGATSVTLPAAAPC